MQQHRDKKVQDEFDTKDFGLHLAVSQGWHFGIEENFLSPNLLPRSATSSNQLNFELFGGQISEVPGGRQEQGSVATSILSGPKIGEYLVQETQQDQVGSSNIYPELQGVPHYGTSPPFVLSEEPVYVNAKQYHAILRRRQLRAKAEMENKATRVRKPYLHESRHLHALRRARGCGGRFINTKKSDNSRGNATQEEVNSNDIDHSPPSKMYISESVHYQYSSTVTSDRVEPSSSTFDDYKMLSLQGSNCADYFQWSHHKSFLSK